MVVVETATVDEDRDLKWKKLRQRRREEGGGGDIVPLPSLP